MCKTYAPGEIPCTRCENCLHLPIGTAFAGIHLPSEHPATPSFVEAWSWLGEEWKEEDCRRAAYECDEGYLHGFCPACEEDSYSYLEIKGESRTPQTTQ